MNFVKSVLSQFQKRYLYDSTLKENNADLANNTIEHSAVEQNSTIEHCARSVKQNVSNIEELKISQFYNGSETDNSVRDEFSNEKGNVEQNTETIINISDDEETLNIFDEFGDFHSDNNTVIQNNKHDTETELTLGKENCLSEIIDFEEVLKEFMIKGDEILPKCNMVDLNDITASNIINEELNLDEFDKLFDIANDLEESKVSNEKTISKENTSFNQNSDSKTSEQAMTEYKQVHEIQFEETNKFENFEMQSDIAQTPTLDVNASIVIDLTIEEHSTFEIDDTKSQKDKIEATQDLTVKDGQIKNTGEIIEESYYTKLISINNDHIGECNNSNKISKVGNDNITIDILNERDNNIPATSYNEPTIKEAISLLPMEANIDNDDFDFCSGYHSSDFEFITESDAEGEGLITKSDEIKNKTRTKPVVTSKNALSNEVKPGSSKDLNNSKIPNYNINENFHQPEGSNSKTNTSFANYNKTYSAVNHRRNDAENYRSNHVIPRGEEYLNLFQGIYAPMFTNFFLMEHKSVIPPTCMNVEYERFDIRMPSREDSDEEGNYRVQQNCCCKGMFDSNSYSI